LCNIQKHEGSNILSTLSSCVQLWRFGANFLDFLFYFYFIFVGEEYFFQKQGICDRILYFQNIFPKKKKTNGLLEIYI
jgi:hypothetical protein